MVYIRVDTPEKVSLDISSILVLANHSFTSVHSADEILDTLLRTLPFLMATTVGSSGSICNLAVNSGTFLESILRHSHWYPDVRMWIERKSSMAPDMEVSWLKKWTRK